MFCGGVTEENVTEVNQFQFLFQIIIQFSLNKFHSSYLTFDLSLKLSQHVVIFLLNHSPFSIRPPISHESRLF